MAIIKVDQPKMVKYYMNELCKKKKVVTLQRKTKMKERASKKKYDVRASYKMEENVRYFTTDEKKKTMKCKDCDLILMPEHSKPVYLCKDISCNLGLCFNCYHQLREL